MTFDLNIASWIAYNLDWLYVITCNYSNMQLLLAEGYIYYRIGTSMGRGKGKMKKNSSKGGNSGKY